MSLETQEHLASTLPRAPNLQSLSLGGPRSGSLRLELDPNVAACQVLAALAGGDVLPADAFEILAGHSRKLNDAPDDEILDSLTRQSVLLESLWLHFAARSATESKADHSTLLCKAALNCQRALQGCLGAIHQLTEKTRNAEALNC